MAETTRLCRQSSRSSRYPLSAGAPRCTSSQCFRAQVASPEAVSFPPRRSAIFWRTSARLRNSAPGDLAAGAMRDGDGLLALAVGDPARRPIVFRLEPATASPVPSFVWRADETSRDAAFLGIGVGFVPAKLRKAM